MLTCARLAPWRRERAKLVKLDREAFIRVNQRSAQPIRYMNGARSRVGGAIGQTELTLLRLRVTDPLNRRHGGLEAWEADFFRYFPSFDTCRLLRSGAVPGSHGATSGGPGGALHGRRGDGRTDGPPIGIPRGGKGLTC